MRVRSAGLILSAMLVLTAAAPRAGAQAATEQRVSRPFIQANGEATVTARPDQVEIDIGVTSQAATSQAAAAENAKQLEATLAQVRKAAGPGAEVKTVTYSVTPNYRYPREGGQPTITGYTARNIVQVKMRDLAAVSRVIDSATQAGANTIHRLRFGLKDEQAARSQALREATAKARANAEAIAAALGVKIVRVLSAEQGESAFVRPVADVGASRMAEAMAAPPTPVEPGTVDVRATVTLMLEVAP